MLGIAGACFDVLTSESVQRGSSGLGGKIVAALSHPAVVLAGLATAVVCLLVASAVGALFNPPLVRNPGIAMLSTLAAAILAVATDVSPAGAALRHGGTQAPAAADWPGVVPAVAAVCLLAATWTASALAAARRDNRSISSS